MDTILRALDGEPFVPVFIQWRAQCMHGARAVHNHPLKHPLGYRAR